MSTILENFKNHAEYGVVPDKLREGVEKQSVPFNKKEFAPKNSFFQALLIIDYVGPVKDVVFGVNRSYDNINSRTHNVTGIIRPTVFALTNIALQPLYLAFACLSYWPAKLVSNKTEGRTTLKRDTESLMGYSNMLSGKAEEHSRKVGKFINTVLNYAFTFVIWAAAFILTPAVWLGDKVVSSKVSETKAPEPAKDKDTEIGAASTIS